MSHFRPRTIVDFQAFLKVESKLTFELSCLCKVMTPKLNETRKHHVRVRSNLSRARAGAGAIPDYYKQGLLYSCSNISCVICYFDKYPALLQL